MEDYETTLLLQQLSGDLYRYYNQKVIILLDEYDTPMQEAYVGGYWRELAVWRRNSQNPVQTIPVKHLKGQDVEVFCAYPRDAGCRFCWNKEAGSLTVELPGEVSVRVFELKKKM